MKCDAFRVVIRCVVAGWMLSMASMCNAEAVHEESPAPQRMVRLRWTLGEGDTLFYEQQEHHAVTELQNESIREWQTQWSHHYRWDVILRQDDYAAVAVSFWRVRHSTSTTDRTIRVDTYRPIGPGELDSESKRMQDEAYRFLGARFVFVAFTSGAVTFAEEIFGDETSPLIRVPNFVGNPDIFTPCDSITFPSGPVRVGESWSAPLGSGGRLGFGRFRLVGEEVRNGFDCWLIEGDANYSPAGKRLQVGKDVLKIEGGRLTSKQWFDSKRGRLVEAHEAIPIRVHFRDGRVEETVVTVRRRLIEEPEELRPIELSRSIAGGETLALPYLAGIPLNAHSDWADVVASNAWIQDKGGFDTNGVLGLEWRAVLKLKVKSLQSVVVYDVTCDPELLLLEEQEPAIWNRYLMLQIETMHVTNPDTASSREGVVSERIFKIVLQNRRGETRVLYQPAFVYPAFSK